MYVFMFHFPLDIEKQDKGRSFVVEYGDEADQAYVGSEEEHLSDFQGPQRCALHCLGTCQPLAPSRSRLAALEAGHWPPRHSDMRGTPAPGTPAVA